MNGDKITKKYVTLFFLLFAFYHASTVFVGAQNVRQLIETKISFPTDLGSAPVNFNLQSQGNKKFKLVLEKPSKQMTDVKIYDILGNLILHDQLKPADGIQKSYDFTHLNSKLFVVEVGNSKYNKTKSVYANPPGSMERDVNLDK